MSITKAPAEVLIVNKLPVKAATTCRATDSSLHIEFSAASWPKAEFFGLISLAMPCIESLKAVLG